MQAGEGGGGFKEIFFLIIAVASMDHLFLDGERVRQV